MFEIKEKAALVYIDIINKMQMGHSVNLENILEACKIIEGSQDLTDKESEFIINRLLDTYFII